MSLQGQLEGYLLQCCETHQFESCAVSSDDGLLIAMAGLALDEELSGYIPKWVKHSEQISLLGGMGNMSCAFIFPENKSGIIAIQKVTNTTSEQDIFLTVRMKRIPADFINNLHVMSQEVLQYT